MRGMFRVRRVAVIAAGALAWMLALAPTAGAVTAMFSTNVAFTMGVHIHGEATCDNTGTTVEFSGTLDAGEVDVVLTFKNNVKGTRQDSDSSTATVSLTPDEELTIPKSPARGGVGGNPWIWFDLEGDGLGDIALGRCVQGLTFDLFDTINMPGFITLALSALDCSNKGSVVTLGGEAGTDGLGGTLTLSNNRKLTHTADGGDATIDVTLDPEIEIRKGGGQAEGAGGNPWIYVQVEENGSGLTDQEFIGRCRDLR